MSKNLNLIAHCGANYVERNVLSGMVLPPKTETFVPIGHDYFVDLVEDRLNEKGLKVASTAFALGHEGANMFGMMEVHSKKSADFATVIGLRNSHIKWFAASIACGSGVFVCDNLAFSGEVTVGRKHTSLILDSLGDVIDDAVGKVIDLSAVQSARYDAYKKRQLTPFEAEYLIVEMLRRGAINTGRVEKVVEQWDTPDHKSFAKTGDSGWRLFNAATESLKGLSVNELAPRTRKLHDLIDEVVEFDIAA